MGNGMTTLSGHRKTQMALFASFLIVMRWVQSRKKREKRKKRNDVAIDPKREKAKLGKLGQSYMWKVFLPKSIFSAEASKILVLLVLNVYRVFQALRATNLVRIQDLVIISRDADIYWKSQKKLIWLCVEMSLTHTITKYVEKTLGLLWKRKLTSLLHDKYFSGHNFYHVETELVDSQTKKPTNDADSRMTEELEKVVEGYASFLSAGLFNICSGTFYLAKLWNEYGFLYAGLPFGYIFAATALANKIAPLSYRKYRELTLSKAQYRNGQTRLVVNSEAVASLGGGEREASILSQMFSKLVKVQRAVHKNLRSHNMALEFLVQKLLWIGCGWGIIGWGVFRPAMSRTIESIALVRADVGYKFVLFTQVVLAALKGSRALSNYNKLRSESGRIYELVQVLNRISKRNENPDTFRKGDSIEFENVDIKTPTGNLLVKSLSFDVGTESSLLLTGHNGAGKSSIFRTLAGLWKIDQGTIMKPPTSSTFYLPQKPYNVVGTLVDQITYPEEGGSRDVSRETLRNILCQVELEYLLDRPGVLKREINWEDELSLGEKQRLAIARVLYHKPKYCILDECTSGVSTVMEKRLYHLLNAQGISYITISHRPMLKAMHCKSLLILGDKNRNYEFRELQSRDDLMRRLKRDDTISAKESSVKNDTKFTEQRISKLQGQRSVKYDFISKQKDRAKESMRRAFRNVGMIPNLVRILKGAMPNGNISKLLTIFGGIALKALLADLSLFNIAGLFRALFTRDANLLYRLMIGGVAIGLAESAVNSYTQFTQNSLQVDLLETLTNKFMKKYVSTKGYYSLKNIDGRIQDAETRLSDDIDECVTMLSGLMMDVVDPTVKVLWLGRRLALTIGGRDAGMIYGYLFLAGIVARIIMPDFKGMTAEKNKADGRLRYALSSVRTHSESIAFFGGGERERKIVWRRFLDVMKVENSKLFSDMWFGWYKELFVNQAPERLQQHFRFNFAVKEFSSDVEILSDGGASLTERQHMIWGVQNTVKRSIRDLVQVSDKFESLSGVLSRLSELDVVLDDLRRSSNTLTMSQKKNGNNTTSPKLEIRGLDIVTPTGVCVARGIDLNVTPQNRLLVSGPNATGKTSLFRVLAKLWPKRPSDECTIRVNGDMAFVPQRVYSVFPGSLLDQITYPKKLQKDEIDEKVLKRARDLLKMVGIDYLVDRYEEGLHAKRNFCDVLSLGEQQRLGMARLFFRAPRFAILDECTDAVSVDVEERLYETATKMGITVITISKRLALENFHEQELRLGEMNENGFYLRNV